MIRKALIHEVPEIRRLLTEFAQEGEILPRTLADLYGQLRDYYVYREDQGPILGIAALHIFWEDIGEIRSLVVVPKLQKKGLGSSLVKECLVEAQDLGLKRVFVLTSIKHANFFERFGFQKIDKEKLPHIIWAECVNCLKYPDCDEIPMVLDLKAPTAGA